MKENLEFERKDIEVDKDMEIDPDNSFHLRVYPETWFDVKMNEEVIDDDIGQTDGINY